MEIVPTFFPSRRTWSVSALAIGVLLSICPAEASGPSASTDKISSFREPRKAVVIDVELGGETGVRAALGGLGARVVAFLGPRRWLVAGDRDAIASLTGIASASPWQESTGKGNGGT